jgi:hypothetical protein
VLIPAGTVTFGLESQNIKGRGKGFLRVVGGLVPWWVLGAQEGASCQRVADGIIFVDFNSTRKRCGFAVNG